MVLSPTGRQRNLSGRGFSYKKKGKTFQTYTAELNLEVSYIWCAHYVAIQRYIEQYVRFQEKFNGLSPIEYREKAQHEIHCFYCLLDRGMCRTLLTSSLFIYYSKLISKIFIFQ